VFLGTHHHLVDDKGRVAIPARFRGVLSGLQDKRLVVTKFKRRGRPCLDTYTMPAWEALLGKIALQKRFERKMAAFESWYVGWAQEAEVDGQGRILVPPPLRQYACLDREVVIAGVSDKFRIWNKDLFYQVDGEDEHEVMDVFDDLGL
jgi:MraZ protein